MNIMEQQLLQKISQQLGGILEWQKNHEQHDDDRFASMAEMLENQPTKSDFDQLANKEDIARLNNIVHNFLLGITLTQKFGKWGFYAIITVGGIAGGFLVLKAWVLAALAYLGFSHVN